MPLIASRDIARYIEYAELPRKFYYLFEAIDAPRVTSRRISWRNFDYRPFTLECRNFISRITVSVSPFILFTLPMILALLYHASMQRASSILFIAYSYLKAARH